MCIAIRPADAADMPSVAAIYADAVSTGTATFETRPPSVEEMARPFGVLESGGFPYLVADRDGHVAGYAYAGPYRQRTAYGSTVEDSVYVGRHARGTGLGRALLQALILRCEAIDCRLMVAVIADGGSPASTALHASLGFTPVGTLVGVGYKHGRWLDTTLMQRPLGPGVSTAPTRS